jgi:hypothetical protein
MTMPSPSFALGCIADDFTGATDLANNLVRAGMRVMQTIGVPSQPLHAQVDAVVVALKSRTIPAAEAVDQSLKALHWLQAQGAQQIYFKYCSTFDSTAEGNIGPVTEALMDALGCDFTVATPAFPDNGRTVFKGYLFAGHVLLNVTPTWFASCKHRPSVKWASSITPLWHAVSMPFAHAWRNSRPTVSGLRSWMRRAMTIFCVWGLPSKTCRS